MGAVFGIIMAKAGYSAWLNLLISIVIYAGAMQFVAVGLLAGGLPILIIVAICLNIDARHFYAIASLDRYGFRGWRKWYLVFSVTDETFAILNLREQKAGIQNQDKFTIKKSCFLYHCVIIAIGL